MARAAVDRTPGRWHAIAGLLRGAWKEYERDYARYLAVAMIYYALLSLVPMLLLLLAALGLVLRFTEFSGAAEQQVLGAVEASFGPQLRLTLEQLLAWLQQESIVATVVSLAGLILTASALFHNLRLSFRAIWKYTPPLVSGSVGVVIRATLLEKLIAFGMVAMGGVLLIAALALLAMIQWLSGLLGSLPLVSHTPAWLLALPGPLIIAFVTFALLLKSLPPVRLRWRDVWLAALLCTVAWTVGAEFLVLYGASFGGGGVSAYGAIGGLLVVMLWMNVVSQMLFYGGELCKVVSSSDGVAA